MPNIVAYLLVGIMGVMGGLTSIYLLASIPAMIVWKIYRKVRYGYSLFD